MIVRLVRLLVGITLKNFAATGTAEETLSHATKGTLLCMLKDHSIFLHHKKISLKFLTDLSDDLVGYGLFIIEVELQTPYEKCYVIQLLSYIL